MLDPDAVSDARFDRFVDGELSAADERDLLTRLDDEPHGWRRLALAFVEAQSWRRELGDVAAEAAPAFVGRRSQAAATSARSSLGWATLAVAAALAFGCGLAVRGMLSPGAPNNGPLRSGELASLGPHESSAPIDRTQVVPGASRQTITLYNAAGEPFQLPLVEASQVTPDTWQPSDLVPRHVREALRRSGFEVEQERQLLPFDLQDGRRIVVPVDNVDVRYRGEPEWQ